MCSPLESFDYFYKIIVIGDEGVGKTNLMQRVTGGGFLKNSKACYNPEFEAVTLSLPGTNQRVRA